MTDKKNKLFGGKGAEEYEIVMDSIYACAKDAEQEFYEYMHGTPKTSFVVLLVDKIHEQGYKIVKS